MKPTRLRGMVPAFTCCTIFLVASVSLSVAGDFQFCSVGKGVYYDQTGGGTPVMKMPFPYLLHLELISSERVTLAVNVKRPNGFKVFLFNSLSSRDVYSLWSRATNETSILDGDYVFECASMPYSSPSVTITNSMVSGTFPAIPTVSNLSEAQSVNPSNDFTLTWNAFTNGTVGDYISLEILRDWTNAFATPRIGMAGALDGTAVSVTIPAGTLSPGRAYIGRLVFAKTVGTSTNEAIGAGGASFLFSQTDFWIKTQGAGEIITPQIVSTIPPSGQTNVPPNMPITVFFNKPMNTSYSISGAGSVVAFSPDGMQLVMTPPSPYAQGSLENIIFNPLGHSLAFRDIDGNPLPSETFVLSYKRNGPIYAPMQSVLGVPKLQNGNAVDIELQGEAGFSYAVEYSTNLLQWIPLQTNIAFTGIAHVVDSNLLSEPKRFYRAVPR